MYLRLKETKTELITCMPNQFLFLIVHLSIHPGAQVDNLRLILDFSVDANCSCRIGHQIMWIPSTCSPAILPSLLPSLLFFLS